MAHHLSRGWLALAVVTGCVASPVDKDGATHDTPRPDTNVFHDSVDPADSDVTVPDTSDTDPVGPLWPFRREVPMVRSELCSACAIDADGALFCWGDEARGCSDRQPGFVGEIDPGPFRLVVQSNESGIAVREDGTVFWWPGPGLHDTGWQYFVDHEVAWVDLDGTPWFPDRCGVDALGYLYCALHQDRVPTSPGWRTVSAGNNAACAVHMTDGLSCWGDDHSYGDLPDRGADAIDVAMGFRSACIVTRAGTVRCGGRGAAVDLLPASFPRPVVRVAVESTAACALMDDGAIACWGRETGDASTVVTDVPDGGPYVDIDVVADHACAITATGHVDCWGVGEGGVTEPPTRP